MLKSIDENSIAEKLHELLESVSQGQQVTILRRGIPLAYLTPADAEEARTPERVREALDELKEIGRQSSLSGLDIRKLIDEGRRF
jgi:prevent-host-death family protein